MRVLNYDKILGKISRRTTSHDESRIHLHKINQASEEPVLSIVLVDWECRERFHSLDWLLKQDVPKAKYELIWVELYNRVVPEVLEKVDVLITCGQEGLYHKHIGYNVGLLHARGAIVTICDSDAVFPPDFVSSVLGSFHATSAGVPSSISLMHHELRTSFLYPDNLIDTQQLKDEKWCWWPLNPNVGACASVRKADAVRFGGFDEHKSYRGYLCGPYDLVWRLVNSGVPEMWHDTSTVLWHFAHPDPAGVNGLVPTLKMLLEYRHPHVDLHALTAVEAFSTGRLLPLKENPEIFALRMGERKIGSTFEKKYACLTGGDGFSKLQVWGLKGSLFVDLLCTALAGNTYARIRGKLSPIGAFGAVARGYIKVCLPPPIYDRLRYFWRCFRGVRAEPHDVSPLRSYKEKLKKMFS